MTALRRPDRPDPSAGHISPALFSAYTNGSAGPADAWSAEAHLVSCPMCRAELRLTLTPADRQLIGAVRTRLTATRPVHRPVRRWVPGYWRLVLRPNAIVAVLVALIAAVLLDLGWRYGIGSGPARDGLIRLLVPVLPLAGIALCSVGEDDPCREAVLAAPSSGLRLVLWRTVLVLLVAIPAAALTGFVLDGARTALWLLPCLALTTAGLALGTVVALERAAAVVALGWAVVAVGPAVALTLADPLRQGTDELALSLGAQPVWAALALVAAAALVRRRDTYEQLPTAAGSRLR